MTSDASPVNHYLLFDRADEFNTDAKVDYALRHHRLFGAKANTTAATATTTFGAPLGSELDRRMLVRTLEELKRGILLGDRGCPMTPSTGNTFNTSNSAMSSPDFLSSPQFDVPVDAEASTLYLDGTEDLDAKPWDNVAGSQANYWNWPMEVLYQSYHLWIALDYGRDVFSITRNGVVLVDRIPTVVASILQVLETTLHARDHDMQQLRTFVEANIADEQARARVLHQVWNPSVHVSIVLLNVPPEGERTMPFEPPPSGVAGCGAPFHAPEPHTHAPRSPFGVRSAPSQRPSIIMFPPEHRPYTALETEGSELTRCSVVTLLSHCDARELLNDDGFMNRLRNLLTRYENASRERSLLEDWPQSSLSTSIEYLVRAMPDTSAECNTVVFVSNVGTMSSSDTLTFLENMVRRKNIVVSLVALNRFLMFDSPELSPLARFLSCVGGFAVHVDYWLALAAPRLNSEWCRKFEGARCLAQQLFVHLINRFPVAIPGVAQHDLLVDTMCQPVVLYDGDHDLPDFVMGSSARELLCATAALRFNQGWSVLMDHQSESMPSHVAARYDHLFHRGLISLHYEMNINKPAVYRRLLVSGTKALVDHFCRTGWGDNATSLVSEGNGHWLAYLNLLRLQVHLWMKAEQALLQVVSAGSRQCPMNAIASLHRLSGPDGVLTEWLNCAAVASIGVFVRFDPLSASASLLHSRAVESTASAMEAAARLCVRTAMERRHRVVGSAEELTYLRVESVDSPLGYSGAHGVFSLVQFFALCNRMSKMDDFGLAGGFECRVSCVLCDRATQQRVVRAVLDDLREAAQGMNRSSGREGRRLSVHTSYSSNNEQALQLVQANVCPRRKRLLTSFTEGNAQGEAEATNRHPRDPPDHLSLLETCHRVPMLSYPWSLLNALSCRWTIGSLEHNPFLTAGTFSFFVARRLHAGFQLLVFYATSLKAVLAKPMVDAESRMEVWIFDVLEAAPGNVPGSVSHISIQRLVSPFKRARAPLWNYTRDIQEDLHIATALFTCHVLSNTQAADRRPMTRVLPERGLTVISARVESLLVYLHSKYTEMLELHSPPSLGTDGCVRLRDRLLNLVSCVGDRSAVVPVRMLHPDYVRLLSSAAIVEPLEADACVYVSVMSPLRYQTILCVLMLESDTEAGTRQHTVKVALAAVDASLLEYAITQQYQCWEGGAAKAMPKCVPDGAVVQSLRHLLTTFTAVYSARELLRQVRRVPSESTEAAAVVAELTDTYKHLGNYVTEMDITHLLHIARWRHGLTAGPALHRKIQEVLTGIFCAQQCTFPTHPTLWLPLLRHERRGTPGADTLGTSVTVCREEKGEKDDIGEERSEGEQDVLPLLLKSCTVLQMSNAPAGARSGEAEASTDTAECLWIASAAAGRTEQHRDPTPVSESSSTWSVPVLSTTGEVTSGATVEGSARLVLRVFAKTVPTDLLDLHLEDSFSPPQQAVRRTLRLLFYRFTAEEGPAAAGGSGSSTTVAIGSTTPPSSSTGALVGMTGMRSTAVAGGGETGPGPELEEAFASAFPPTWDRRQGDAIFRRCGDFTDVPGGAATMMQSTRRQLEWRVAAYCLRSACDSDAFARLRTAVEEEEGDTAEGKVSINSRTNHDSIFLHSRSLARSGLRSDAGLQSLLRLVVSPALLHSYRFQFASCAVEFTQQATTFRSVDPVAATQDVFRRCVEEDGMWVLPTTDFAYVVVPNRNAFGARWVLVQVEMQRDHSTNRANICCYDPRGGAGQAAMRECSERLCAHIYGKMTQVSQLHLLKQLRDTQNASAELIPQTWGDQFLQGTVPSSAYRETFLPNEGHSRTRQPGAAASFYLRGKNVLEVPLYYKLQHQCKKVLSRIQTNSSRLELITIFNRDQCFVVADDEEGDTFHYIRLVFVKDLAHTASVTTRSPPLTSSDRCPQLVVQLFSATSNARVQRPLQKLQDFCYFLAVQELQGHLNYVQHKMISFNDLVFLQSQRLEPIQVDLRTIFGELLPEGQRGGGSTLVAAAAPTELRAAQARRTQMALALFFLNLREFKFKSFGIQDEPTHATSNFVEHYNLEKSLTLETSKETTPSESGSVRNRVWRFVKIVEGLTDVLVSCCLHVHPESEDIVVFDRYLTKIPAERYINGDSENVILTNLCHCVEETVAQLQFFALTAKGQPAFPVVRTTLRATAEDLLQIGRAAHTPDSPMLRYHHISLEEVSPTLLPMLVERLCGVLAHYSPTCFTYAAGHGVMRGVQHVPRFSWQWFEGIQNDLLADRLEFYVMCGYTVRDSTETSSGLPPTRVAPYVVPGLPITAVTTGESQMPLLCEHRLNEGGCPVPDYRICLSISLINGLSLALFNLRDTEYIVRLVGYVVQEAEEKSALLEDVLLQRMGYAVPSFFSEADLARNCCGDDTNIIHMKPLSTSSDAYRRRINNVRFRVHPDPGQDEPLVIILEGLYNRGLIVNYVFPLEDAIKVLFDECPQYTLQDCVQIVEGLLEARVLLRDLDSALKPQVPVLLSLPPGEQLKADVCNCRLGEMTGVPADALIACGYHRHILTSHIIVEAQNARSGVAEVLATCDAVWRAGPQNNVLELAKAVVTLQLKSKEVFGARVPDFSLRRERWRHEDDVLDPTLPTQTQQNVNYARSVDASLQVYMDYLRQLYPSMCVIDLDPNDPLTIADGVLVNRLRCRYGKVTNESGEVVLFSPHLYYAVIPFVDLLRCPSFYPRYQPLVEALGEEAAQSPITSSGLFVIEVGFQVVHYALDFFVINGNDVSPGVTAMVAADFKKTLLFENVLYDAAVRSLAQCMRTHSVALSGQQRAHTAVANLVKYHPFPPMHCANVVAAYTITDPRVMRLKNLTPSGPSNSGDVHVESDGVLYLSPQKHTLLQREQTNVMYTYGGLIIWERAQLFVLLTTATETNISTYESNADLTPLVLTAKALLLNQLLDSTQQERLDAAWHKFLAEGRADVSASRTLGLREATSYDEFELLRGHSHRIVLHSYLPVLQTILEPMEWVGDARRLRLVCAQLFPDHTLHVLWRPHAAHAAGESSSVAPVVQPLGDYNVHRLFMSPSLSGCVVITFASHASEELGFFLAMECVCDPDSPHGASIAVEELSLYCKPSRVPQQQRVMTFLGEMEQSFVERFVRLMNSYVWSSIVPCSSQFMV